MRSHGAWPFASDSLTSRPRSRGASGRAAGRASTRTTLTFRRPSQSRIAVRAGGTSSAAPIATTRTITAIRTGLLHGRGRCRRPRIAEARSGFDGNSTSGPSCRSAVSSSAIRLSQVLERTRRARLHGPRPDGEGGCGLVLGELEEEPAGDHEPFLLAQAVDRGEQALPVLPREQDALGGRSRAPRGLFGGSTQSECRTAPR